MSEEEDVFSQERIEGIAAALDLRRSNQEALESIAYEVGQHFEIDGKPAPFRGVVDSATAVGKTYILAAAIDYFAAEGVRNFAVIAPGRTILNKTVTNFTLGHKKSLLAGMETQPVVITSENFNSPVMRAAMDDPDAVKLYIFTVQALTNPTTKVARKTRKYQERLGQAFYERLQEAEDLMVFADEHHCYFGPAFATAVAELHPRVLIGLTATPHRLTPPEEIIFRYPLAAAIADRIVKTPVLVGRKDDLHDPATKLLDGIALLELKEKAIAMYCAESGADPINPLMLVIAPNIEEANEIEGIIRDPSFVGGRYADKVLTVHSNAPDEALAELDKLDDSDSPHRIVVSVGMLKEGWDNRSVYVIASMRASVSTILTEQTLGRGLRLPFGAYTGYEILDTLEVLGHERYEELLKRAGVLNEEFVDRRTRAVLRKNAEGKLVPTIESTEVSAVPVAEGQFGDSPADGSDGKPVIASVESHIQKTSEQVEKLQVELYPRQDLPTVLHKNSEGKLVPTTMRPTELPTVPDAGGEGDQLPAKSADAAAIVADADAGTHQTAHSAELVDRATRAVKVPVLKMTAPSNEFSLADITDYDSFRKLGERIAADPVGELRRYTLGARIVLGPDGIRRTDLVTAAAVDKVVSAGRLLPLEGARADLLERVLASPGVPQRKKERDAAAPLIEAFLQGLGDKAEAVLSNYMDRAAAGVIAAVTTAQRKFAPKPSYEQVVELASFEKTRTGRPETSTDRTGAFKKGVGYEGYKKSLYVQDWFDSSTERTVANIIDDADEVAFWVRLQRGDLPILWAGAGGEYNPDFLVVETDGTHWVVEAKMDKEMPSTEVQGKREAARRWANHVTADEKVGVQWRYLLASETDIKTAKSSWPALKGLGS